MHYERSFIKPDINPRFTHLCKLSNAVSKWLFGNDLGKKVKNINEEQKATAEVIRAHRQFSRHERRTYEPCPSNANFRRYQGTENTNNPKTKVGCYDCKIYIAQLRFMLKV